MIDLKSVAAIAKATTLTVIDVGTLAAQVLAEMISQAKTEWNKPDNGGTK